MKKKIVACLLCMAMAVSTVPMPMVQAAEDNAGIVLYEEGTDTGNGEVSNQDKIITVTNSDIVLPEIKVGEYTSPVNIKLAETIELPQIKDYTENAGVFKLRENAPEVAYSVVNGIAGFRGQWIADDTDDVNKKFDVSKEALIMTFRLNTEKVDNVYLFGRMDYQYGIQIKDNEILLYANTDTEWPTCKYTVTDDSFWGKWHDIVAIFTGSNMKLYVDGVGTEEKTGTLCHNAESKFTIGYNIRNSGEMTKGYISDIKLYKEDITENLVITDYPVIINKLNNITPEADISVTPYTSKTTWSKEDGTELGVNDKFEEDIVYKATTVLTAREGYLFEQSETVDQADTNGVELETNVTSDGKSMTITATYPKTEHDYDYANAKFKWQYQDSEGNWKDFAADTDEEWEAHKEAKIRSVAESRCKTEGCSDTQTEEKEAEKTEEAATCIKEGKRTYTASFAAAKYGDKATQKKDIQLSKLEHDYDYANAKFKWQYQDSEGNWKDFAADTDEEWEAHKEAKIRSVAESRCKTEGCSDTQTEEKEAEKTEEAATCTKEGKRTYTASFAAAKYGDKATQKKDIQLSKLEHDYDYANAKFKWQYQDSEGEWKDFAADTDEEWEAHKEAKIRSVAESRCKTEGCSDTQTEAKEAEKTEEAATCIKEGKRTYTASFAAAKYGDKATQKKDIQLSKLEHDYDYANAKFKWQYQDSEGNWKDFAADTDEEWEAHKEAKIRSVAESRCKTEGCSDTQTEEKEAEKTEEAATCIKEGKRTYTASFAAAKYGDKATQKKDIQLSKLEHDYDYANAKFKWQYQDSEGEWKDFAADTDEEWEAHKEAKIRSVAESRCKTEGCSDTQTEAKEAEKTEEAATCIKEGKRTYTASFAAAKYGDKATQIKNIRLEKKPHMLNKTAAKAATCTAAGNSEYYICSECGKYFSDAAGKNEIAKDSWVIKAKGHTITKKETPATADREGKIEYSCDVCKNYVEKTFILPKTEISVYMGKTANLISDASTSNCSITLANAKKYKKYFTLDTKTGKIKTSTKKLSKVKIKKTIPVKVTVDGKAYNVNVKLKIAAPKITIKRSSMKIGGIEGYRYKFKYNIKGAKKIRVRVKNMKTLNAACNKYLTKPRNNSQSFLNVRKSSVKGKKLIFEIVAYYGKNTSEAEIIKK